MANEKLWVASVDGRTLPKPEEYEDQAKPGRAAPAPQGPPPEEGLRRTIANFVSRLGSKS